MNVQMAEKALAHYEDVKVRYKEEIAKGIAETKVYGPKHPDVKMPAARTEYMALVARDTVSCLFKEKVEGKVCLLNFADYKQPGGMYLEGSFAQEECLCHESILFPILLAFDDSYYAANRKNLNRALYRDRALYIPNVIFEHGGETKVADVLTCAAPNIGAARRFQNVSDEENRIVLKSRIDFMKKIVIENECDTLILGAWGCGVFSQNPYVVAKEIQSMEECVKRIYYAIPGGRYESNFVAFEEVLGE